MDANVISTGLIVRQLLVYEGALSWSDDDAEGSFVSASVPKNDGNWTSSDVLSGDGRSTNLGLIIVLSALSVCMLIGIASLVAGKDRVLFCCPGRCEHLEAAMTTLPADIEECHIERSRVERRLWYQHFLKPYTSVRS